MAGRDSRVQLVGPGPSGPERGLEQILPFADLALVPAGPVLLGEQDRQALAVRASWPAGIGEQEQRQQATDLRLGGQDLVERPGQPDRLVAQSSAEQAGATSRA